MNATAETTIRDIVTEDYRAAAVFQQHGIDFCCGGNKTIDEACRGRGLNAAQVLSDVARACATPDTSGQQFGAWEPPALVDYIVTKPHGYVRQAMPTIAAYTRKLSSVHGPNHPELIEVERLFAGVVAEMTMHMMKEEQILFPFIVKLAEAAAQNRPAPPIPFGTVANPIRMMEDEHESAGNALARIRTLTSGYQPPEDACTTYRVGLQELEAFEEDLHAHVHLENNILFPRALRLESELR